jgi:hypothetical protein
MREPQTGAALAMNRAPSRTIRLAALELLAIPVGLLALLLIDNFRTGDYRMPGHVMIETPLVLAMATLWRWPRQIGAALLVGAVAGTVVEVLQHPYGAWQETVFVDVLVFGPPLLAGLLLVQTRHEV